MLFIYLKQKSYYFRKTEKANINMLVTHMYNAGSSETSICKIQIKSLLININIDGCVLNNYW